jgi:hypothetical protein
MNTTIKKAQIKDGNYLSVEYTEQQADGFSTIKKDCKIAVHIDLKNAFKELDKHLANLSYQHDDKGDLCTNTISCKGFSIGGSGDSEGVTLTGVRTLENDKILNISSPFQRFDSDYFDYDFISDLIDCLDKCKEEVNAYLFAGKHEEDNQLELFEELEEIENQ